MRRATIVVLLVAIAVAWAVSERTTAPEHATIAPTVATSSGWPAFLPAEAQHTLRRIESGGPFEYRQDGAVFQNRERRLPHQAHGYYREYTVDTPGAGDRGARRIVSGGDPPVEYFYTDDHYRSFRRFVAGDLP